MPGVCAPEGGHVCGWVGGVPDEGGGGARGPGERRGGGGGQGARGEEGRGLTRMPPSPPYAGSVVRPEPILLSWGADIDDEEARKHLPASVLVNTSTRTVFNNDMYDTHTTLGDHVADAKFTAKTFQLAGHLPPHLICHTDPRHGTSMVSHGMARHGTWHGRWGQGPVLIHGATAVSPGMPNHTRVHMHAYTHTHTHTHACPCTHMHTHGHTHACTHAHAHICTHTHTHTHMHTFAHGHACRNYRTAKGLALAATMWTR